MEPGPAFPYQLEGDGAGRWHIVHAPTRRRVATFKRNNKGNMQLERLRLWWEHAHAFPFAEFEEVIVRALARSRAAEAPRG